MPRIADYAIIRDGLFRINTKLTNYQPHLIQDFKFNMPSGFHRGSRSILFFTVQDSGEKVEFRIFVNNETTFHGIFSGSRFHSLHEVIGSNVLNQTNNTIRFALDNGTPNNRLIDFGDVFILCQTSV